MEVGKQIKKFRQDLKLSQEELASKIFVTRQTISNWENGKNYPDVNSLVLLSQLFNTSLDILVKGDVIEMKKQVAQDDVRRFKRDTVIFTVLIILTVVSVVPLFLYLELSGIALWLFIAGVMIYYAMRLKPLTEGSFFTPSSSKAFFAALCSRMSPSCSARYLLE